MLNSLIVTAVDLAGCVEETCVSGRFGGVDCILVVRSISHL